jgi:hypothetical protein
MTKSPFIDYRFKNGSAKNTDGSFQSEVVNCTHKKISINQSNWGKLTDALSFGRGSHIKIPHTKTFRLLEAITLEFVVRIGTSSNHRLSLFEGQKPPLALFLYKNENGSYSLSCGALTGRKWRGTLSNKSMPTGRWVQIAFCYSGDDLFLFINGKLANRRVLEPPELRPFGDLKYLVIGTGMYLNRYQFTGDIAGFRVWDGIAFHLIDQIEEAEQTGYGAIGSKYDELGKERSFLGPPTSSETKIAGGRKRIYNNGAIYWSPQTEAHEVHGGIYHRYKQLRGPNGILGYPTTDEISNTPNLKNPPKIQNLKVNRFENGAIYSTSPTNNFEVVGNLFIRYLQMGAEKSFLGLPIDSQRSISNGKMSKFQGGTIYWSPDTDAFEVHGAIARSYDSLKGPNGFLRFPLSNEEDVLDAKGRRTGGKLSRFQGGTIYWSRETGAFEVHEDIRKLYEETGGPTGELGYPITHESKVSRTEKDIRYNNFQNGCIIWTPKNGAEKYTELELYLGWIKTGPISDEVVWDHSFDILPFIKVVANGRTLQDDTALPRHHRGTTYHIDKKHIIKPVKASTRVNLTIKVYDWDQFSANDYFGGLRKTFDIRTRWGLDNSYQGIYSNVPRNIKRKDMKDETVTFDFRLAPRTDVDPKKHFREQMWWQFDNFNTKTLNRLTYQNTFSDVDPVTNWFEKWIFNPFESMFYELLYKGLAKRGNCFGMSLEAVYAIVGRSIFAEPLYQYPSLNGKYAVTEPDVPVPVRQAVNHKHGYQAGSSSVRMIASKLLKGEAANALKLYQDVKNYLRKGDYPTLSLFSIKSGTGHNVMPYRCEDGKGNNPHKIYVADPNIVWKQIQGDATWVEIRKDNSFWLHVDTKPLPERRYESGRILGDLLPMTLIFAFPYHVLSSQPTTPFWEVIAGIGLIIGSVMGQPIPALLGGLYLITGNSESEQIKIDGEPYYEKRVGVSIPRDSGIPGFTKIPFFDAEKAPELYIQAGLPPKRIETETKANKKGKLNQIFVTKSVALSMSGIASRQAEDKVCIEDANTARPMLRIDTNTSSRKIKVNYAILSDTRKRKSKIIETDLPIVKNDSAYFGAEKRGQGILVSPAGSPQSITVKIGAFEGKKIRKSLVKIEPKKNCKGFRIRPYDPSSILGEQIVEILDSNKGQLIERKVVKSDLLLRDWSTWTNLGRPPLIDRFSQNVGVSKVIVGKNLNGRSQVFSIGIDSAIWSIEQTNFQGGWGNWKSLGKPSKVNLRTADIGRNEDGRLELFSIGIDGNLWHNWQIQPNKRWKGWYNLKMPSKTKLISASVGQNQDGRLEVFAIGANFGLWHIWQTQPNNGWSRWESMGKPIKSGRFETPIIAKNKDGRLELFMKGFTPGKGEFEFEDTDVWHRWQTSPNNGWSRWESMGSPPSGKNRIIISGCGQNQDGRLEIFVISGNKVWHKWQTAPNNGWSHWASLGKPENSSKDYLVGFSGVAQNYPNNELEVFVITGKEHELCHIWQTKPNNGWSQWDNLNNPLDGTQIYSPTVGTIKNGRLTVFAGGSDGNLWNISQI